MATVTSLTETRIQELLAGWESIGLSQDEINALVVQLRTNVLSQGASLDDFNENVRPQLEADLAANSAAVSDLNDNVLPTLQADLAQAALDVENLNTIDIPALRADMENTLTNVTDRPNVYVQDEAPENPDVDDRDLVVGDVWYDSNDNNTQRIWNGTEWSSFNIDITDLTITAKSFISGRHQIY